MHAHNDSAPVRFIATPPAETLDAIRRRTLQIAAIARLMGAAGVVPERVTDVTLENAAWAIADLADQVEDLADRLHEGTHAGARFATA